MARILVPEGDRNVTVYDPAAGSGTLVLALAHEIGEDNCTIYTQDRSQKANEFMRLNLILNGQVESLANVVHDNTLTAPRHLEYDGNSIKHFDYLASDKYAKRFWAGVPNIPKKKLEGMSIYLMFLQHILVSLKPEGKAAIVVPTGFLTAKGAIEKTIRKRMVDERMLRGVISMPSNIFANTGTNVSIIFLDKSREHDHALLMNASSLGTKEKVGKTQRTVLSDREISRIINTFNAREEQDDFSVLADYDDIKDRNYSFSAGQYFEVKIEYTDITPEEFQAKLDEHMASLHDLFEKSDDLQQSILNQLRGLRYA